MASGKPQPFAVKNQIEESLLKALLRKLDFDRMQIEALIREYKPTMVLVEHDKAFREEIGTKHILIEKERE